MSKAVGADFDAPIPSLEIVSFGGAACVNRSGNIECYLIPAAMSRGHGKVERIILQVLNWGKPRDRGRWSMGADAETLVYRVRADGQPIYSIGAEHFTATRPTRSELEVVRRALRNLRKQGLIEVTKYRHVIYKMPR
jgi:hypothetical protein